MPRTRSTVREERAAVARVLGRRLATAREAVGMTQQQVAKTLGIPQSQIAKTELGIRQLRFIEGLRLAELYALDPIKLDPRQSK